jgi:hypothetical protein
MSPHVTPILVALKTVTLILGGLITFFSWKAYRRSELEPLWYLAVGFGIVTTGILIAGIFDQVFRLELLQPAVLPGSFGAQAIQDTALVLESALTALGFAVIVYSLYSD